MEAILQLQGSTVETVMWFQGSWTPLTQQISGFEVRSSRFYIHGSWFKVPRCKVWERISKITDRTEPRPVGQYRISNAPMKQRVFDKNHIRTQTNDSKVSIKRRIVPQMYKQLPMSFYTVGTEKHATSRQRKHRNRFTGVSLKLNSIARHLFVPRSFFSSLSPASLFHKTSVPFSSCLPFNVRVND